MNNLSPRERLLRTLSRQPVDRPPVLCTGGMMNAAISAIVATTANTLPTAHSDPERMTELAVAVQQATGFENLGAPFCLTVEAEALGSLVDLGTATRDPTLTHEVFPNLAAVCLPPVEVLLERGRVSVFLAATARLARQYPTLPVLANLIGPTSTAAALVAPLAFIKGLCKDKGTGPPGGHQRHPVSLRHGHPADRTRRRCHRDS